MHDNARERQREQQREIQQKQQQKQQQRQQQRQLREQHGGSETAAFIWLMEASKTRQYDSGVTLGLLLKSKRVWRFFFYFKSQV